MNGTLAETFSKSTCNLPLAPVAVSAIFSVSTGEAALPMVIEVRPTSVAGSLVVLPSLLTPQM